MMVSGLYYGRKPIGAICWWQLFFLSLSLFTKKKPRKNWHWNWILTSKQDPQCDIVECQMSYCIVSNIRASFLHLVEPIFRTSGMVDSFSLLEQELKMVWEGPTNHEQRHVCNQPINMSNLAVEYSITIPVLIIRTNSVLVVVNTNDL